MKILTVTDKTERILRSNEATRDSDAKLVAVYYHHHLKDQGHDPMKMSSMDLLTMFYEHRMPSYEAISRARRKLQETKHELRGKKYAQRQAHQKDVKKELGYDQG